MAQKTFPQNPSLPLQQALLIHPESNPTAYIPLQDAAAHPFVADASSWSRVNAWWLADASWLAYSHDEQSVADAFARHASIPSCTLIANAGTECYLAHNNEFAIVAFRGTQPDDWHDLFNISRFAPKKWDIGVVHHGFIEAFEVVWPAVEAALNALPSTCRVWFTGHSLGGALASMAAVRRGNRATGLYTFGSPRVGDGAFAAHVGHMFHERSIRYVNDHDIVAHVPPPEFALPRRYTHVDVLRWIAPDGHVSGTGPLLLHFVTAIFGNPQLFLDLIELSKRGTQISLPETLTDHTPLYYALHTWNDFDAH